MPCSNQLIILMYRARLRVSFTAIRQRMNERTAYCVKWWWYPLAHYWHIGFIFLLLLLAQ